MTDAPAFDFYPERFWFAVEGWPDAEIVRYWRLLSQQWMQDGLPDCPKALRSLARGRITDRILAKFPVDSDGKRRNAYLETVRASQRERIKKSRERAQRMNEIRWKRGLHKESTGTPQGVHTDNVVDSQQPDSPPLTTHHSPHTNSLSPRPTLSQALAVSGQIGVTETEATEWWEAREASDWLKSTAGGGTTPVGQNWQADMKRFVMAMREKRAREAAQDAARAKPFGKRPPPPPPPPPPSTLPPPAPGEW